MVFATAQTINVTESLALSEASGPETIVGPSDNLVTLSGNNSGQIILVEASTTASIANMELTGGYALGFGGGIENSGVLALNNCDIVANAANGGGGGGIANRATGQVTITDSVVSANSAIDFHGGGIFNAGVMTITSSTMAP